MSAETLRATIIRVQVVRGQILGLPTEPPRPLAITATGRLLDAPERVIATTHELGTLARLGVATRHTEGCRHCPGHPMAGLAHGDHVVIGVEERVVYRVTAGRVGIWRMERVA